MHEDIEEVIYLGYDDEFRKNVLNDIDKWYEEVTKEKITYICGGYPSYLMTDFIPFKRLKEYKEKYQSYNTERNIDHNSEYKIIHEGYKNQKFYDIINRMKE